MELLQATRRMMQGNGKWNNSSMSNAKSNSVQEQKHESAGAYQIPQLVQSIHLNIILPKLKYMGMVWSHKWDTIKEVDLD